MQDACVTVTPAAESHTSSLHHSPDAPPRFSHVSPLQVTANHLVFSSVVGRGTDERRPPCFMPPPTAGGGGIL